MGLFGWEFYLKGNDFIAYLEVMIGYILSGHDRNFEIKKRVCNAGVPK